MSGHFAVPTLSSRGEAKDKIISFFCTTLVLVSLPGCCLLERSALNEAERNAVELCGKIDDLRFQNISIFEKIFNVNYPDLTPELRASARRTNAYCIELHLGKMTEERYERLMALEAPLGLAAEQFLTKEQFSLAMKEGYTAQVELLKKSNIPDGVIQKLVDDAVNKSETAITDELNLKNGARFQGLEKKLGELAGEVANAKNALANAEDSIKKLQFAARPNDASAIVVQFDKGKSTLAPSILNDLKASVGKNVTANSVINVIGSADSLGDRQKNDELALARAKLVANWLISEFGIPATRIHVISIGSSGQYVPDERNRAVTIRIFNGLAIPTDRSSAGKPVQQPALLAR